MLRLPIVCLMLVEMRDSEDVTVVVVPVHRWCLDSCRVDCRVGDGGGLTTVGCVLLMVVTLGPSEVPLRQCAVLRASSSAH